MCAYECVIDKYVLFVWGRDTPINMHNIAKGLSRESWSSRLMIKGFPSVTTPSFIFHNYDYIIQCAFPFSEMAGVI